MEREILRNIIKFRSPFQKTKIASSIRCNSSLPDRFTEKSTKKTEEVHYAGALKPASFAGVQVQQWNEFAAIRREKRAQKFPHSIKNAPDLLRFLQSWNSFPGNLTELRHYLKRRRTRLELAEQQYLPQRVAILKPDLAAAHFLLRRGGHVKFLGSQHWVGFSKDKKTLPVAYVPGMFIEAIKAEGTNLIFEGLQNLNKLRHLTSLSLRNLTTMNDWCMDLISKEHCSNLKHLDISGCKNITYRGLSCFYRFECLNTLNVEGIPDTPEFKVACLMLLEIMPDLEIQGIDLSIPEKIDPVGPNKEIDQPDPVSPIRAIDQPDPVSSIRAIDQPDPVNPNRAIEQPKSEKSV